MRNQNRIAGYASDSVDCFDSFDRCDSFVYNSGYSFFYRSSCNTINTIMCDANPMSNTRSMCASKCFKFGEGARHLRNGIMGNAKTPKCDISTRDVSFMCAMSSMCSFCDSASEKYKGDGSLWVMRAMRAMLVKPNLRTLNIKQHATASKSTHQGTTEVPHETT